MMTLAMDAQERYEQKRLDIIKRSLNKMHGVSFVKVSRHQRRAETRVDTRRGRDHNMCSWDTLVHQVQTHRAD